MCTLSNCIFLSFSLQKKSSCEFIPLQVRFKYPCKYRWIDSCLHNEKYHSSQAIGLAAACNYYLHYFTLLYISSLHTPVLQYTLFLFHNSRPGRPPLRLSLLSTTFPSTHPHLHPPTHSQNSHAELRAAELHGPRYHIFRVELPLGAPPPSPRIFYPSLLRHPFTRACPAHIPSAERGVREEGRAVTRGRGGATESRKKSE